MKTNSYYNGRAKKKDFCSLGLRFGWPFPNVVQTQFFFLLHASPFGDEMCTFGNKFVFIVTKLTQTTTATTQHPYITN